MSDKMHVQDLDFLYQERSKVTNEYLEDLNNLVAFYNSGQDRSKMPQHLENIEAFIVRNSLAGEDIVEGERIGKEPNSMDLVKLCHRFFPLGVDNINGFHIEHIEEYIRKIEISGIEHSDEKAKEINIDFNWVKRILYNIEKEVINLKVKEKHALGSWEMDFAKIIN